MDEIWRRRLDAEAALSEVRPADPGLLGSVGDPQKLPREEGLRDPPEGLAARLGLDDLQGSKFIHDNQDYYELRLRPTPPHHHYYYYYYDYNHYECYYYDYDYGWSKSSLA